MAKEEIRYEIREYVGTIAKRKNGWNKEINVISWNDQPPKYDIRDWSEDHSHMGRGITLFADEMKDLVRLYTKYQNRKVVDDAKADEAEREEKYWSTRKTQNTSAGEREIDIDEQLDEALLEEEMKAEMAPEEAQEVNMAAVPAEESSYSKTRETPF